MSYVDGPKIPACRLNMHLGCIDLNVLDPIL